MKGGSGLLARDDHAQHAVAHQQVNRADDRGRGHPEDAQGRDRHHGPALGHPIAAGRNNAQIAEELYLSPKTIRNNVSSILAKLQATDRAEVIIRARDAGLGRPRP
jgi:FixJ family two-component response regulator